MAAHEYLECPLLKFKVLFFLSSENVLCLRVKLAFRQVLFVLWLKYYFLTDLLNYISKNFYYVRQIKNINCQTSNEKLQVWEHFNADFLLSDGEMKRHEASVAGWVGSDWGPERPAEELGLYLSPLWSHRFKWTSDRICWVHSSITQSGPTSRVQGTVLKATTEQKNKTSSSWALNAGWEEMINKRLTGR